MREAGEARDRLVGIILAAGIGRRLKEVLDSVGEMPKSLLVINGFSLMERMFRDLRDAQAERVYVVTGFHEEKVMRHTDFLSREYQMDVELVRNTDYVTTNTGASLMLALERLGNGDVVVFNGDVIYDRAILEGILGQPATCIVVDNIKSLTEESFKVVIRNGMISAIGKELPLDESTGEYIGIARISEDDRKTFQAILEPLVHGDPMAYYDSAFEDLSRQIRMFFFFTDGLQWTEIDYPEDLENARRIADKIDRSRVMR